MCLFSRDAAGTHCGHSFNGWGVTLVDALDTMWIMGLREQFQDSMPKFANLTFSLPEVRVSEVLSMSIR